MGGILGNDAWRRSNGGLWLPRVFGMPETVYGWCCCGEEEHEPDEQCQFCYGLPALRYLQVEVPEFPCGTFPWTEFGGTFVLNRGFTLELDISFKIIGCRWLWYNLMYTYISVVFRVLNTGTIEVVISSTATYHTTIRLTYRLEHFFSGDPPFPCMDVFETELPLVSVDAVNPIPEGCLVGGEVVYASFLEGLP